MRSIHAKTAFWSRFAHWTNRHAKLSIGLSIGLSLVAVGLVAGAWYATKPNAAPAAAAITEPPPAPLPEVPVKYYSPLTGVEVDEPTSKRWTTGIMIENSPDARPQSGLKDAGIIYEAIAEGGITRFLAIYQEGRPQLIGPVRSVRPYYVDWVAPYDAAVAHIGGSKNALDEIRNGTYKDIDQFFNAQAYWRATDRYAPHNVYTSFDKLDDLNRKKNYTTSTFTSWPRKSEAPAATKTATKIDIAVSSATYSPHYDYDPATNSYLRSHGGTAHTDREGGRLSPKVVIAIKVPTHRGFEDGYREQMDTVGHNKAFVFQDGVVTEGFWHKPSRKAPMVFYDTNGKTIAFNQGQTWVTVTAPEKQVTWQ